MASYQLARSPKSSFLRLCAYPFPAAPFDFLSMFVFSSCSLFLMQDEVVLINYFNMASTESLLRQTHAKGAKSVIVLARPSQFPSISKLKNTLSNTFSEGQLWIVKKPLVKAELLEAIVNFSQLEATQRASSRPGEEQPPSLTKQPAEEGSQPWKVLAVDDNSVNRKMIIAMLKRIVIGGRKVDCVTAVDGVDAVAKVLVGASIPIMQMNHRNCTAVLSVRFFT
jgi:hypothetical protein